MNHDTNIVVVQLLSHVQLFVTSRTATCQASLSFTISGSFLKLVSTEVVMLMTLIGMPINIFWNKMSTLKFVVGTSLVLQWLRLRAPNAGGPGSISGQGIHMPQFRVRMIWLQIPHAAIKNIEDSVCHNEDAVQPKEWTHKVCDVLSHEAKP